MKRRIMLPAVQNTLYLFDTVLHNAEKFQFYK